MESRRMTQSAWANMARSHFHEDCSCRVASIKARMLQVLAGAVLSLLVFAAPCAALSTLVT